MTYTEKQNLEFVADQMLSEAGYNILENDTPLETISPFNFKLLNIAQYA